MEGKSKRRNRKERLKKENSPAPPNHKTYQKDQGRQYYCHKYQANRCGALWQLGEDQKNIISSPFSSSPGLSAHLNVNTTITYSDAWASLVPSLIFLEGVYSQPHFMCLSHPISPSLHSSFLPILYLRLANFIPLTLLSQE